MKKIRLFTVLGLGALSIASLASCGNKEKDAKEYENGELKVAIPTGVIRTAGDIIGLEKGFFDEEGVKVTGVNISGTNAITAINNNSNELDILTTGFVPDVQAISNGNDNLRFIGGTAVEGGALIAKKGEAYKYKDSNTIIDFDAIEGASLAFAIGEASFVVTNEYLIENDPDYNKDELNISNLADAQTVALQIGQGNFEVGFLPLEYANLYKDSYGIEIIAEAGQLIPEYVCCRQLTSKQKYETNYKAFVAYEKARIKAWEFIENDSNRNEVVDIIANYIGKETDYVENYLYGGITKWSVDPNKKGIETYTDALRNAGVLKNEITNITSYVEVGAYEEAITYLASTYPNNKFYKDKLALFNEYNK
jgi:NitT/TauT family transport system substrate-binding protein